MYCGGGFRCVREELGVGGGVRCVGECCLTFNLCDLDFLCSCPVVRTRLDHLKERWLQVNDRLKEGAGEWEEVGEVRGVQRSYPPHSAAAQH